MDSLFRFVCGQFLLLRDSMVLRDSAPADRAVIATCKKDKGEIEKEEEKKREEKKILILSHHAVTEPWHISPSHAAWTVFTLI